MQRCLAFSLCLLCIIVSGCSNSKNDIKESALNISDTAIGEVIFNPGSRNEYFYDKDSVYLKAEIKYDDFESYGSKSIDIKVHKVENYEYGEVYKIVIEPAGMLTVERLNIYLYVTKDKIYRLWSYEHTDDGITTFYDDDDLLISTLDSDEKLIKNGEVVCQLTEMDSGLETGEEGKHFSIVKEENQIRYSRCDVSTNGEPYFYEWFTWEAGNGLVEYGSGFGAEKEILYLENIVESP